MKLSNFHKIWKKNIKQSPPLTGSQAAFNSLYRGSFPGVWQFFTDFHTSPWCFIPFESLWSLISDLSLLNVVPNLWLSKWISVDNSHIYRNSHAISYIFNFIANKEHLENKFKTKTWWISKHKNKIIFLLRQSFLFFMVYFHYTEIPRSLGQNKYGN